MHSLTGAVCLPLSLRRKEHESALTEHHARLAGANRAQQSSSIRPEGPRRIEDKTLLPTRLPKTSARQRPKSVSEQRKLIALPSISCERSPGLPTAGLSTCTQSSQGSVSFGGTAKADSVGVEKLRVHSE